MFVPIFAGKPNMWNEKDNVFASKALILKLDSKWVDGRATLNNCLPGRHHSLIPPGWSSCSSEPSSERRRDGHTEGNNSVNSAARTFEVYYRTGPQSLTCATMTAWCAVYSGGLQGSPSSSDMVPASSVRFTHMRDGGEPSLMACFSWSWRNTKHPPPPNLSAS